MRNKKFWWMVLGVCSIQLIWAGCSSSQDSDPSRGGAGDVGNLDTSHDSGNEPEERADADRADAVPTEDDTVDCEETWETASGTSRCCSQATLACETFRFGDTQEGAMVSTFDPSSDVLSIVYDRSKAALADASVSATITDGSSGGGIGGGSAIFEEGSIEGNTITVDFSSHEFGEDEVLEIDNVSIDDVCGSSEQFIIGTTVDPHADSVQTGFDCEKQPDFDP